MSLKNLTPEHLANITKYKYPPSFYKAIAFIIKKEGGYVNNPNDPGGETKYGISKRSFPNEDIKNLSLSRATELYYQKYYKPLYNKCFAVFEDANIELGQRWPFELVTLDSAINHGTRAASRFIQRAINKVKSTTTYKPLQVLAPLKIDGDIGPVTRTALLSACKACTYNPVYMSGFMLGYRLSLYTRLAVRKSNYGFLRGWVNRIASIIDYVYSGC